MLHHLSFCLVLLVGSVGISDPDVERTVGLPPGAAEFGDELRSELESKLAALPDDSVPRTRHRSESGAPLYTNRLLLETSPYLLQHAHNPVNWYPWSEEAFEKARELGRPVFLSIGYSTCHWCHVMEEESFEDIEIARYLNEHYVSIKLDREERPDLDQLYMGAVQALTGSGGWPMTVVLTPDRKPFFAGTYFPPNDGDRGFRLGFRSLVRMIAERYAANPEEASTAAERLTQHLHEQAKPQPPGGIPPASLFTTFVEAHTRTFDEQYGGTGIPPAPKFPRPAELELLLRVHRRAGDPELVRQARITLDHMIRGGIHDQLGGGFHRYSTDREWLVPHFEKMLYDQAQMASALIAAYQVTGDEEYARVARGTLDLVLREFTSPEGMFYSATDADSATPSGEREEGYFFTWTRDEVANLLAEEELALFTAYYPLPSGGNFEGRTILHTPRPLASVATDLGLEPAELRSKLAPLEQRLLQHRSTRPAPLLDDKGLASWNGLMISAFARGALVFGESRYRDAAKRAMRRIAVDFSKYGELRRLIGNDRSRAPALLIDHAAVIQALLDVFEIDPDPTHLRFAQNLEERIRMVAWDEDSGGYFDSAGKDLLHRSKARRDGAVPAGNSIMVENLVRLHTLTLDDAYRERATAILRQYSPFLTERPTGLPRMLAALDHYHDTPKEIVVALPAEGAASNPFREALARRFLPNRALIVLREGEIPPELENVVPWIAEKGPVEGKPTAYVCEERVCLAPTTAASVFSEQITTVRPYPASSPEPSEPPSSPESPERPRDR